MKFLIGYEQLQPPVGLTVNGGTSWTDVAMVVIAAVSAFIMLLGVYIKWKKGRGVTK